jgi:hypothetical protein
MRQFYVPDEESAKRCHYSRDHKAPVTVSGVDTSDNKTKLYTAVVVQSVEDYGASSRRGRRWRVIIFNSN